MNSTREEERVEELGNIRAGCSGRGERRRTKIDILAFLEIVVAC